MIQLVDGGASLGPKRSTTTVICDAGRGLDRLAAMPAMTSWILAKSTDPPGDVSCCFSSNAIADLTDTCVELTRAAMPLASPSRAALVFTASELVTTLRLVPLPVSAPSE